jgi:hypothetical protein
VVTSDNPRSEDPAQIIAEIEAGMRGDYRVEVDRAEAIAAAIDLAAPGDCVLIAGKGHEDYQIIGSRRMPFSDSDVAQRCRGTRHDGGADLSSIAAPSGGPSPALRCRGRRGRSIRAAVAPGDLFVATARRAGRRA